MTECRLCRRKFEHIIHYPRVRILSFEKVDVPKTQYSKHYLPKTKKIYGGRAKLVREVPEIPEIKTAFSALENLVGEEVERDELLRHITFGEITIAGRKDMTIEPVEAIKEDKKICVLQLVGAHIQVSGRKVAARIIEDIAYIQYEGVFEGPHGECPLCENKLEHITDYPLIHMVDFERIELEEIPRITQQFQDTVPGPVLEKFGEGEDPVSFWGKTYTKKGDRYSVAQEVSDELREAVAREEVQNAMAGLEGLVGTKVKPKNLHEHLDFSLKISNTVTFRPDYMHHEHKREDGYRECIIELAQQAYDSHSIRWANGPIARIVYKGVLKAEE